MSRHYLAWPVPVTLDGLPRFPFARALAYVAAELSWWSRRTLLDDPGVGELADACDKVRIGLPATYGAVDEALRRCAEALHSAARLRGAAPAIRLRHIRAACVEAASARLVCLVAGPVGRPPLEAATRVIRGEVLTTQTV